MVASRRPLPPSSKSLFHPEVAPSFPARQRVGPLRRSDIGLKEDHLHSPNYGGRVLGWIANSLLLCTATTPRLQNCGDHRRRHATSSSDVTHVPSPTGRGAGGRAVLADSRLAVRSKGRQTGAQILQSALTPNHKLHPERVGVALVVERGGRHADVPPGQIASEACMRVRICLTGNDGSDKRGDSQKAMRGRQNRGALQIRGAKPNFSHPTHPPLLSSTSV